jgi:hypothetical protein
MGYMGTYCLMIISFVTVSSGASRPSMPAMFFRTPSSRVARSEENMACVDEPPSSPGGAFNSNITHGRLRDNATNSLRVLSLSSPPIIRYWQCEMVW